ncbi:MAG: phenylalanine--tRNA ligase subunit beta [Clostridia bacterium]|nr:phenylalanine--tRNA ligase subunit beta [Clostridia bacterium]
MFLSMNWICDFVDLSGLDRKSLIKNFTLSTAEVEDIIVKGEDTYGVVVAEIVSIENHPNSKKLHLLKVNNGKEILDVVCGAPNVRVGMRIPFVGVGGSVSGHAITEATIAGYPSFGMCCSESEIGISDDHSGLMEIFEDAALGTDIKDLYDIDDIIFEVDNKSLTNRPDLWSHYGIAREFATITNRPLKAPTLYDTKEFDSLPPVAVDVKATDLVWRYTALKVENITRKTSPVNMRIRLYYCGSRAINFLADLTNYVMMELGQPMHAFDNEKVDKIEVQTFPAPFTFTTLDGIERQMDEQMLMITSGDAPVAVAGIMGGDASKIEDTTTSLLLESATFDGVSVRKTSTRLGLRTDASMRYEKMLDPELCKVATERLLYILKECDSDVRVVSSFTDAYVRKYETITLTFDKHFVNRYTGIEIANETIVTTLTNLGFAVTLEGDIFTVTVPSWRSTKDVTMKADIIEEISRIYGYDNFAVETSVGAIYPIMKEREKSDEDRLKDLMVKSYRMHEVHSYIWQDQAKNASLGIATEENVRIINAQTPDHQYLRSTMIPTLLSFVRDNRAYGESFGIFEIGHVVEGFKENGYCDEYKKLGAVFFDKKANEECVFLRARDAVCEVVSDILHYNPTFELCEAPRDFMHPANAYNILVEGECVGFLSVPHPVVLEAIDKKAAIAFFEVNTTKLSRHKVVPTKYKEPSKFPSIDIDLTFRAEREAVVFDRVVTLAHSLVGELLTDVKVHDIYESENECALTLRFTFSSMEKTLSKQELAPVIEKLTAGLASENLVFKV